MITDEQKAIKGFWAEYKNYEAAMARMSKEELTEYLEDDLFISVASSATGIPERKFADHGHVVFGTR